MGELMRRFWVPVLLQEELPAPDSPPVRVRILGEDLVAFRDSSGRVGLLDSHCPHRLADLFFGRNEECGLRCVYHGWKFDVEGNCVDMPNEPAESSFKQKIRTTAYPTEERGGIIWAYLGPKDLLPAMPDLDYMQAPASHRFVGKVLLECNYFQSIEGDIDNSHVGFLHSLVGTTTVPGSPVTSSTQLQYQMRDKTPRGFVKETPYGILHAWRRNADLSHYHWRYNHWLMPFYSHVAGPPGSTLGIFLRPPRDDETTWAFVIRWHPERPLTDRERTALATGESVMPSLKSGTHFSKANRGNDFLIDRALQRSYSFTGISGSIYVQDMAITETMTPIVDRSREHLGTSDVAVIAVRRMLRRLARELQDGIEPHAAHHGEVYRVRCVEGLLPRDVPFSEDAPRQLLAARP
jgi:phenylpropionate dioxygenase-like ring-hydroxylating dioxygenase large terminal subunit